MNPDYENKRLASISPRAHIHAADRAKWVVCVYILSLLPCLLFGIFNIGLQSSRAGNAADSFPSMLAVGLSCVLPRILATGAVTFLAARLLSKSSGRRMNGQYLIPALLIPMMSPPSVPAWMLACATLGAILVVSALFYATGRRVLNTALLALFILYILFPSAMGGPGVHVADSSTGATPLAALKTSLGTIPGIHDAESRPLWLLQSFLGLMPGAWGETSVLCVLLGGVLLIVTRVASRGIIFSALAGGLATSVAAWLFASPRYPVTFIAPLIQLCLGGFAFAVVFIATDPSTAPVTSAGRRLYGFLIGVLSMLIRFYGIFPEGVIPAVLVMNLLAPAIDKGVFYVRSRRRLSGYDSVAPRRFRKGIDFGSVSGVLMSVAVLLPLLFSWSVLPGRKSVGKEGVMLGVTRACRLGVGKDVRRLFETSVKRAYLVNYHGAVIDRNPAHVMQACENLGEESSKSADSRRLPVWECATPAGLKYVLPLYGWGMHGAIQGFIALDVDGRTIYGAWFFPTHETRGLGARLTDENIARQFSGLSLFTSRGVFSPPVIGAGSNATVEGVTGATFTEKGLNRLIKESLEPYTQYLRRISE